MTEHKTLREKLLHECKEMLVIFCYLALFFCAVATYRMILLKAFGSASLAYGFALVKALVLAKVILLGRMAKVSRLFDDRPLIVPTLYKVALFAVFVLAFEVIEHLIGGIIHGKHTSEVLHEVISGHRNEILARSLVVLSAFVPYFAFTEVSRVLGEGRLRALFWHGPAPHPEATPSESNRNQSRS